ncbi:MAG: endopeptidase La [Flavobacteriales bacterium]|jgi:ATP-dependent Lon protease|uniref:endopeptidase La n=1 Tax=Blattabacterium sp. (Mastotermes darwiniensis) TaxID=39768 RepID=UPI000231DF6B|nr:endopeptidase La [Blattabacterium sp. (Mastotermes darwiniensis)]AER40387.1 ATP-dependent protease [Blattabacterium sp. (Mastotermes darwiniensis) str. MADAR]MDR1804892.1 endopeptidase La [Flavobacteriales bacterium]
MLLKNIFTESGFESEAEFIPLMSQDEEDQLLKDDIPEQLCILTVRNMVLYSGIVFPIIAGKSGSIQLLQDAYGFDKTVGVLTQKNSVIENISEKDLYSIGTVAKILKLLKMPDGNTTVILQGKRRFKVNRFIQKNPYFKAEILALEEKKPSCKDKEYLALVESIKEIAIKIIQDNPNIPSEASIAIRNIESPSFLINFVAANMNLATRDKQKLLEYDDLKKRAMETLRFLNVEHQQIKLKNDIQSRVRSDMDQQQREYFLHQQIKAIQEELGDISYEKEIDEMRAKASRKKWPKEAKKQFDRELLKMQRTNPQMPEYTVQRNYLELMIDLPWERYSKDNFDLEFAQKILDRDHYGLEKVKERIIEYLAVLKLRGDMRSPILCFYGPPGVGKTSLGRSIATALKRKYVRVSLGGLHDESEIRGHRRTYIGAMPGRLLQSIRKVGTSNPVFVIDEIDKIGLGTNGDPSSAMLEVLDPEQNTSFYDNFLEMGYDLSKVLFIATANSLSNIQPALIDRMEVIEMNGYTVEEKTPIVKKHILPKQLKENGLKKSDLILGTKQIEKVIESYTRESGLRTLEKNIAKLARYAAKNIAMNRKYVKRLSIEKIEEILGIPNDPDRYEVNNVPGVVTGLAWTNFGGDILYIESSLSKGKGNLSITGNLGTVMKESATIALQYIKAHYEELNIDPKMFEEQNVHVHVPEGAVPKDGPSAGIAMLTSLVSSYTKRKLRPHLAMTGEITLRGKVLPVGGIKEKILAARRANIKDVILSQDNKKDVEEIKQDHLKGLTFDYVRDMNDVINLSLL